jgi:DNA polymerase I-like protein with 3'-5' exonuclease and polymerase domains
MAPDEAKSYVRTTVYLTEEQRLWLRRVAAQAQLDGVPLSASDVVRLALVRMGAQLSGEDLRRELVAHVKDEVRKYPGRAKRGLPSNDDRA